MAVFNSDGFQINYELFTGESGNNVLFIHGNLASNEWWAPSIEVLRNGESKSPTILCADWRGYGKSQGLKKKSEINFETYAEDYIRLVEHLNLRDIDVVGHSTGGMIAMMAILKRPNLFRSCVLLDSVGSRGLEPELPLDQILAHFETMADNKEYFTQVLAATVEGYADKKELMSELTEISWQSDKVAIVGVPEVLCKDIDFSSRMGELQLPTLILHGRKDLVLPLSGSEELNKLIQNSQLKVIEEAGHSYCVENPSAFALELETFWKSI